MLGAGNRVASFAGVLRPLIAGRSGSAVSPHLSGWPVRLESRRLSPALSTCLPRFQTYPNLSNSGNEACTAPPPQQFKAAPPGTLTREHRTGPRSSRHRGSLNRIGSASPLPRPVLRCKRRSQLSQNRTPLRPHVLHPLPCRYGEGDLDAVADGTSPPARDALGAAEQTTGQRQGRSLVDTEPVSFHELDPANYGTEGRVDLVYLNSLAVAPRDEVRLDPAVAE